MADKIDQLKLKDAQGTDVLYDIDLPVDATPSIASLTTSGNVTVGGSLAKGNLTFTLPSSSGTLTLDENLPIVSFGTAIIPGATEIKSISIGTDDYNLGGGGAGTITEVKTTAGAHTTIDVTSGAAQFNVPTKTSHLTNDSGYVTSSGVTSITLNTSGTGISINSTAAITSTGTRTITLDSSSAGNAAANKVVLRNAAGSIQSEKIAISSGTTTKATIQYDTTDDCVKFIFS